MLFSEGFEGAKVLAKKMTVLYKLSKEQLSKQFHYDFGLRALKSVLVMAGGLKRQYEYMSEELVLMRCLRDSNMPKFGEKTTDFYAYCFSRYFCAVYPFEIVLPLYLSLPLPINMTISITLF